MGTPVTFNGLSVVVPENNDQGWGSDVSALLIELANFAATTTNLVQSSRIATVTPVTIGALDYSVGINIASASVVNLPAGTGITGKLYLIYDFSGAAKTNPITITPAGSDTINGQTNYILSNNNCALLIQYTGTRWNIVSEYYLPLQGPQSFNQSAVNTSFVTSATLPAKALPTVTAAQSATVTFSGSNAYLFSVSLGNNKSCLVSASNTQDGVTVLSDPDGIFAPTVLDTGIFIGKSPGATVTFTNNTGGPTTIEIKSLTTDLVSPTAWS